MVRNSFPQNLLWRYLFRYEPVSWNCSCDTGTGLWALGKVYTTYHFTWKSTVEQPGIFSHTSNAISFQRGGISCDRIIQNPFQCSFVIWGHVIAHNISNIHIWWWKLLDSDFWAQRWHRRSGLDIGWCSLVVWQFWKMFNPLMVSFSCQHSWNPQEWSSFAWG